MRDFACQAKDLNYVSREVKTRKFFKQNELLRFISENDLSGPKLGNHHWWRNYWLGDKLGVMLVMKLEVRKTKLVGYFMDDNKNGQG